MRHARRSWLLAIGYRSFSKRCKRFEWSTLFRINGSSDRTGLKRGLREPIEAADIVASVAGYRILRNLTYGKFLYVDDLVTRADHKRAGYAGQLLEWLCEHARDQGCSFFILDSGVQRFEAHRFYLL